MPFKDPEKHRASARAPIQRRRAIVRQITKDAKNKPCMDCNKSYPYYVMHLDHRRGVKKYQLSYAQRNPTHAMIADLPNEIAKCDVVCANCHALRHPPRNKD